MTKVSRVVRQAAAAVQPATSIKPVSRTPSVLSLNVAGGGRGEMTVVDCSHGSVTVPNVFLRDSSTHPAHLHPSSRQKLFRTSDVPVRNELKGWNVHPVQGQDCLVCEWDSPVNGEKLSLLPVELLYDLVDGRDTIEMPLPQTWDASIADRVVEMSFDDFMNADDGLRTALTALLRDGMMFLRGVPTELKQGHHTTLRSVVERIGSVRRTWYGDLWDVKAEEGSLNIAYTDLDLGLHMDLVHLKHPPRFQFLHSLMNHQIRGGESYFVDSYHVASMLSKESFETLRDVPMTFEYKAGSHHTRYVRPTIELDESSSDSRIEAINYSPPFQGPLTRQTFGQASALAKALKEFAKLADSPELQYRRQLQPGDLVIFDNRRTLHARTAFSFEKAEAGGERGRWLKGAYMDEDEVKSKWRVLSSRS